MAYSARILAVDDEPDLTDLLHYHLTKAGHDVAIAATGWEAIESVKQRRPDLILLDLMLPDLDGFGVCELLRNDPETATIPVIIISAWSSSDSRQMGAELGALDYLTKPFSPAELVHRVNSLVASRTAATSPDRRSA